MSGLRVGEGPRRHSVWRSLVVLPFLVVSVSCSLTDPNADTLSVTLTLDKSTVHVGESVHIVLTAVNVGDHPVSLSAPQACLYFFQVRERSSGVLRYASNETCSGTPVTVSVRENEQQIVAFDWDGYSSTGSRLPSATYVIQGGAAVVGKTHLGAGALIVVE